MGVDQYSLGPTKRVAKEVHAGWKAGATAAGFIIAVGVFVWNETPTVASETFVNDKVATVTTLANGANDKAFHAEQVNKDQDIAIRTLFRQLVILHAEAEAQARARGEKDRAHLSGEACWFFGSTYDQMVRDGVAPAKAAEESIKLKWIPN